MRARFIDAHRVLATRFEKVRKTVDAAPRSFYYFFFISNNAAPLAQNLARTSVSVCDHSRSESFISSGFPPAFRLCTAEIQRTSRAYTDCLLQKYKRSAGRMKSLYCKRYNEAAGSIHHCLLRETREVRHSYCKNVKKLPVTCGLAYCRK